SLNSEVVGCLRPAAPGHAEGADFGIRQLHFAGASKVFSVLGVARGVAALNEIDADFIQPLRDLQLVLQRKTDAFALSAVAERRVVDLDAAHKSTKDEVQRTNSESQGQIRPWSFVLRPSNKKSPEAGWASGLARFGLLPLAALRPGCSQ